MNRTSVLSWYALPVAPPALSHHSQDENPPTDTIMDIGSPETTAMAVPAPASERPHTVDSHTVDSEIVSTFELRGYFPPQPPKCDPHLATVDVNPEPAPC